jgi:hypothetical protein
MEQPHWRGSNLGKRGLPSFSRSRLHVAIVRNVRLLAVPVRTASPSKSQDKISVKGEGCDTLGVTVVATVFIQCLTMYCRSLNETLVWFSLYYKCCVVWISNSISLFSNQFTLTLVLELQDIAYKCAQLNSLLWRTSWDSFLVNLPDFSHKDWTPLKFIEYSNWNLFQNC